MRREAAVQLGWLGADAQAALDALRGVAAEDQVPLVRAAAVSAVGKIGLEPEKAIPLLSKLLKEDLDGAVQLAAMVALGDFGPAAKDAVPALQEADARAERELKFRRGDLKLLEAKRAAIQAALKKIEK